MSDYEVTWQSVAKKLWQTFNLFCTEAHRLLIVPPDRVLQDSARFRWMWNWVRHCCWQTKGGRRTSKDCMSLNFNINVSGKSGWHLMLILLVKNRFCSWKILLIKNTDCTMLLSQDINNMKPLYTRRRGWQWNSLKNSLVPLKEP